MDAESLARFLIGADPNQIQQELMIADYDWPEFVTELELGWEQIYVADELYLNRYFLWPNKYKEKSANHGRVLIHQFVRGDYDRRPHNHPWSWADAVILQGGYTEDRVVGFEDGKILIENPVYRQGDLNRLTGMDFHRVHSVQPDTWTLFKHGPHVKDWGFINAAPDMTMFAEYKGPNGK